MKVFILTYSNSPYRVDFFEELGKLVDLTVCFETTPERDSSKRNALWYGNSSKFYKSIFLSENAVKSAYNVIKLLKKNSFDIILMGGYSSLIAMILMTYLKFKKTQFILNTDGGFPKINESKFKFKFKKHFISMADYYLSTGENANKYLTYYGANENNIYVYPFASLKEEDVSGCVISREYKKILRTKLKLNDEFTFISVGQFIKRKGFDVFLKAAYGFKDCQFLIIGDSPSEDYLNIVKELNLNNVKFINFKPKEELLDWIKASDVFVLSTREDIYGLVIIESLSVGVPVITTNKCGAGLDLIKDNYNGFLIDSENVEELHNKMKYFLDNDNESNRMSINALNSVKGYTIENEAKVHYKFFKEIISLK